MKRTLAFAFALMLILLLSRMTSWAQGRNASEAATTEQRLAEEIGLERLLPATAPRAQDARNVAVLLQEGTGNRSMIGQTNFGSIANEAFVQQVGAYNTSDLMQTGSGNRTTVAQRGRSNRFTMDLTGTNNEMTVLQEGNNNRVESTVISDSRRYTITQSGSNNVLNQVETAPLAPKGYSVEMRGNGIQLTIEQGRVFP
jgi:minor curlin subunit